MWGSNLAKSVIYLFIPLYIQRTKVGLTLCQHEKSPAVSSPCRFSVNVFQPPFQSGRTSPETSQCRGDLPSMPAGDGAGDEAVGGSSAVGAADLEPESQSLSPESQAEYGQASAVHSAESDSHSSSQASLSTMRTTDSGFSEPASTTSCCSLDPHAEKETSCEKAVRPEGDNTTCGYLNVFLFF